MSAASAYRIVEPSPIGRFTFWRAPLAVTIVLGIAWLMMAWVLVGLFVRRAPSTSLTCIRSPAIHCELVTKYPLLPATRRTFDDVRGIERQSRGDEARLIVLSANEHVLVSDRFGSDETRRLQQMRIDYFLREDRAHHPGEVLRLGYDLSSPFALAYLLVPLFSIAFLLRLLDRSRLVLRQDSLLVTHLVFGVWPVSRAIARRQIVSAKIDEETIAPDDHRYRVSVMLSSGQTIPLVRVASPDRDQSEECLEWLNLSTWGGVESAPSLGESAPRVVFVSRV